MKKIILFLMVFSLITSVKSAVLEKVIPVKIDTTEVVQIGGIKQFIKLQGVDRTKPLLLFLHGGPGTSLIPVADSFTDKLKEQFVVVQWDQREAGETLKLNHSPEKLSLDLLQKDTEEVIEYLLKKYNRKKLFLVSHSFGSMLGFNVAEKHPELLYAYIPISAIIDQRKSEKLTMEMLNKWAKETNNAEAVKELALVKIPFEKEDDLFYSQKWLFIHNGVDFAKEVGFKAKYHEWLAIWFPMWKKSVTKNLFKKYSIGEFNYEIVKKNNGLYLDVSKVEYWNNTVWKMHFTSPTEFFVEETGAQFKFVSDLSGKITGFNWNEDLLKKKD